MTILIHFDRSESCAKAHGGEAERFTYPYDSSQGSWVQLTYDSLRTQDGGVIATINDGCDGNCWQLSSGEYFFSDITIEFQEV